MTKRNYVQTILSVINEINKRDDIIVRLILSIDRRLSLEQAMETVELAIDLKSSGIIIGIDMCGNTSGGAFSKIKPAVEYAQKNGLAGMFSSYYYYYYMLLLLLLLLLLV